MGKKEIIRKDVCLKEILKKSRKNKNFKKIRLVGEHGHGHWHSAVVGP